MAPALLKTQTVPAALEYPYSQTLRGIQRPFLQGGQPFLIDKPLRDDTPVSESGEAEQGLEPTSQQP